MEYNKIFFAKETLKKERTEHPLKKLALGCEAQLFPSVLLIFGTKERVRPYAHT